MRSDTEQMAEKESEEMEEMKFKDIALYSMWILIMCILLACLWLVVITIAQHYAPQAITHPLPTPTVYYGG